MQRHVRRERGFFYEAKINLSSVIARLVRAKHFFFS